MRRLLGGGIAIAAFACWLLVAGAAFARQAGGDTISVHGDVLGNDNLIYFGFSGSPIVEFRLDGGPTLHFTGVRTDAGRGTGCGLTPSNFGAFCDFRQGPITGVAAVAGFTGQIPTVVAGSVIFADSTTASFTAPVTDEPPGKPTVTHSYVTGMKHRQPQFYFSLGASQGAPHITGFTVTFPHGLTLLPSIGTLHEQWTGVSFTCARQRRHRIGCHTNTPVAFVSPHLGPSTLVESRALVTNVRENKVKKLPVTVGAIDELQILTHVQVIAPIKD